MDYFKNRKTLNFSLILILSVLLFSTACKKDDTPPDPEPEVYNSYVSHELARVYTLADVQTLYQTMETFYPEISALTDKIKYGVDVYKVTYKTPFQGNEIEVSGLLCVPSTEDGTFPMISFQNGTNTSHAQAPTQDLSSFFFQALHGSASMGYTVLIPDYIGFGQSSEILHPYLHKESTVHTVENFVVAASEMMDAELIKTKWNNKLYLMGYSQGGWSTMCTHKDIVESTQLDFDVTASACGAGPYDLSVVQDFMFQNITYPQPVYMTYTAISYSELGLVTNPMSDYFNEPYASSLPSLFQGQFTNEEINQQLNDTVAVLINEAFLNGVDDDPNYQEFSDAMTDNSVYGWSLSQPIRIYHGNADTFVPDSTSKQVYQEFLDEGAGDKASLIILDGLDHGTAAVPMVLDALIWFNELELKSASAASGNNNTYIKIDASKPQLTIENMSALLKGK